MEITMADERVESPDIKPSDLSKMDYRQLQQVAKDFNITDWHMMNEKQLRQALGAAPDGAVVYDRAVGMKPEQLREIREARGPIPGKTVYYKKDQAKLDQIWARDPLAFNNVDMTDIHRQVQYRFERGVKCVCGAKFSIQREWTEPRREGRDIIHVRRVDKKGIISQYCPRCNKKYFYLDPKVEYDPAKVRLMEKNE
jgi:hypothetical protein